MCIESDRQLRNVRPRVRLRNYLWILFPAKKEIFYFEQEMSWCLLTILVNYSYLRMFNYMCCNATRLHYASSMAVTVIFFVTSRKEKYIYNTVFTRFYWKLYIIFVLYYFLRVYKFLGKIEFVSGGISQD